MLEPIASASFLSSLSIIHGSSSSSYRSSSRSSSSRSSSNSSSSSSSIVVIVEIVAVLIMTSAYVVETLGVGEKLIKVGKGVLDMCVKI